MTILDSKRLPHSTANEQVMPMTPTETMTTDKQETSVPDASSKGGAGAQYVTRDSNIAEVVERYGWKAAEIMQGYGLHCIGCGAASFDTIENGMKLHGLTDEDVDNLVKDVNAAIAASEREREAAKAAGGDGPSFIVTGKAAAKIKELLAKENKVGYALRIEVTEGGCAGMSYRLYFDKESRADDAVFEKDGVAIFIDAKSMEHLSGSSIDFIETLQESGFKIDNPNAQSHCGCGKSFA